METVNDILCEMCDTYADRLMDDAYKRDMDNLREENARLKAALKPVLEVGWVEKKYNYCSGTVPTKDLVLVVRDAQRIYNGGEA